MAQERTSGGSDYFTGEIRVASRIIDYLSSGLYESPSACLKELINNSYDADATVAEIFVKPDADRIIIEDDGIGFDRAEFEGNFQRISESHKRDTSDTTEGGRKKVGKIGIGFIAANELCDVMEVYSTKNGSTELLHVAIHFDEMRKEPSIRRRDKTDYAKADYSGELLTEDRDAHYTRIILKNVRGPAKAILVGKLNEEANGSDFYGFLITSIESYLRETTINTWNDLSAYSRVMLEIGLNVPIQYHDNWLPASLRKEVEDVVSNTKSLNFSVYYDGVELRKPAVFSPDERAFIHRFDYTGESVSASGYFYAQHGSIKPIELQGLLTRIRHAAVGDYDHSFWDFSHSEYSLIQRWISAEIWASDELEDAMNIDRRTLRVTHPAYVELRDYLHSELRKVLARARKQIYQAASVKRRATKAEAELNEIENKVGAGRATGSQTVKGKEIVESWTKILKENDSTFQKAILRKYTVAELYDVVIGAAQETLKQKDLDRFLSELTRRLSRRK